MLTPNTSIPTHARGAFRAFIKGQSGFETWLIGTYPGVESRNVLNSHLLAYAIAAGLDNEVEAILNQKTLVASHTAACDAVDSVEGRLNSQMEQLAGHLMAKAGSPAPAPAPAPAGMDAASILAPVEAFLSPLVKAELEKALAPVIAAANKPAQTVEKIVERFTVQNLSPLPVGALPYATKGEQVTLGSLFGFRGNHAKTPVSTWDAHGAAPATNPFYVANALNMALMASAFERGENVWLVGPSGSGKSTMPEQFAAATGRPCVKLGFTRQTEVADLIGGTGVKSGDTEWQDGALIQAVKRPGTVIILDELTIAPTGVQAIIQLIADEHRSYTLPTGEKVVCAPGVVFVTADNTNGAGDETGQYHGTNQSNQALINRFACMVEIDYMSKADEAKALVNHTKCPRPAADSLTDFVSRARKLPEMESVVLSLRQMCSFVRRVQDGFDVKEAAKVAFLNRLPRAERAAMQTLFTLAWGNEFSAAMSGSAVDTFKLTPTDSPAGQAFDDEVSASLNR